jgi:hypothetical protein
MNFFGRCLTAFRIPLKVELVSYLRFAVLSEFRNRRLQGFPKERGKRFISMASLDVSPLFRCQLLKAALEHYCGNS